ncbi:hypothetical protein D9M70_583210 [compost metagenome]
MAQPAATDVPPVPIIQVARGERGHSVDHGVLADEQDRFAHVGEGAFDGPPSDGERLFALHQLAAQRAEVAGDAA